MHGIDFEGITLTVYKALCDLGEEGLEEFVQVVRQHELKWSHIVNMVLLDNVQKSTDYLSRKVSLLERLVRAYETKQLPTSINGSRLKQLGSTLSTSQIKLSPSKSTLKGSQVTGLGGRGKVSIDPPELTRLR